MDISLNDLIHCHKCKKKMKNVDSKLVQTINGLYRISAKCSICKPNKSKFIKKPEEEIKQSTNKKELSQEEIEVEAKEIHAPVRKKCPKRKIITLGIDDLWTADHVILSKYEDQNKSYKYMLNVIDTFSKYVWTRPLKKKNGINVSRAFEEIINYMLRMLH